MYVKIAMASTDKVEVLGQPLHIRVFMLSVYVDLVSIDQEIIHKKEAAKVKRKHNEHC